MEFGKKLGLLLKGRGITQAKFADEIGVNKVSVSQYVKNVRTPPVDFIMSVIKYFPEVDLNWLLRDDTSGLNMIKEKESEYEIPVTTETLIANMKENMKKLEDLLAQK